MSDLQSHTLSELRSTIRAFIHEREWEQFHSPKHLSMSIAIEAAELMECFQWDSADKVNLEINRNGTPVEATEELADVLIYCLAMADALHIPDLGQAILEKLEKSGQKYPANQFKGRFK